MNCGEQAGDNVNAHYLLKTEPTDYSFADLVRDRETVWDGVTNPAALKFLRAMKPGDKLVIYETANIRSAVGAASVASVHGAQGKEPDVRVKAIRPLPRPVPLAEIKVSTLFRDSPLVRQGRLSVVPLSEEQYKYLTGR
jgi:predicted RNA-binding protein with PUA-like domain